MLWHFLHNPVKVDMQARLELILVTWRVTAG